MPWIDDRAIRNLKGKRIRIQTIRELYAISADARKLVLKDFSPEQLDDIEKFGALFPALNVSYRTKVSEWVS